MTRTFRHRPFRVEDHVARLYRSLKFSGITIPLTPDEIVAWSKRVGTNIEAQVME